HFHNRLVDHLNDKPANFNSNKLPGETVFDTARRLARWHYQWIVVHDFLPQICGQAAVDSLLTTDAQGKPVITNVLYQPTNNPFMPVEFSVAAYRFGHSMIRTDYALNDEIFASIFGGPKAPPLSHLGGGRMLPDFWQIKWPLFFKFPNRPKPQSSRKMNSKLARPLLAMPPSVLGRNEHEQHPERRSLASRNLLRGKALELPSGQAVATAMGETPLTNQNLGLTEPGWGGEAPLWFYILKESERAPASGARLGAVGGRIVAEVLLGLLRLDDTSYVNHSTAWKPKKPIARVNNKFTFADLTRFAQVVEGNSSPGD
ncbi:MAG: peroxidase family protein, partial [Actinomycetota bacterium]